MKGLTLRMSDRFVGLDLLKDKVVRSKPLQHSRMNNTAHMKYMFRNTHSSVYFHYDNYNPYMLIHSDA